MRLSVRIRWVCIFCLIIVSFVLAYLFRGEIKKPDLPEVKNMQETAEFGVNLDVPFATQAPHANWDLPYQEACEEASAILVHYFYTGKAMTPEIMDKEILALVEWEKQRFGTYLDTNAEETAVILREYFGYKKVEVKYEMTEEDVKRELLEGRPVLMPFAGRELLNPFYRQPGPVYHMLVIKGYTKEGKFITSDVGTRRGKDYIYDFDILLSASHEWNAQDITRGRPAMIVAYPNL